MLKSRFRAFARLASVVTLLLGFEATGSPAAPPARQASLSEPLLVTRVEGPSNYYRLGISIQSSGMGRTGLLGPSPNSPDVAPYQSSERLSRPATLTGADLYRLACRSCHKADGGGAPPEINAIFGPVQATSASLMESRMRERGRPITSAFARELASGSRKDLLDRLHKGGQKMPSFSYLTGAEVDALVGHLELLSGTLGAGKQHTVSEPVVRIGELLVKGTCHICHDASGRWPNPEELLQGSVPPISGFTAKRTIPEIVVKVRHGATVVMGSLQLPYRGRMPVFDYLSDDEVASACMYLLAYPP
jgi:mono/diheme cytochrome c family protein